MDGLRDTLNRAWAIAGAALIVALMAGCGSTGASTGGADTTTRVVNKKNPLNAGTKCGAVPDGTEGETELRGVVFQALVIKNGANAMNHNQDLVFHDTGLVEAYCRSHETDTLGQATQKIVGVAARP